MKNIPKIPKQYLGKEKKSCGYTLTAPREWTIEEIEWIQKLKKEGYSIEEIANSVDRTPVSVSIKIKRISKKNNTYNFKHVEEKYKLNKEFINEIKPKTILDLYCGVKSFYKEMGATTNDIDKNIEAQYHEDANKLIHKLYYQGEKYDLIDLDPFGSAYDCFDLAIKMSKKALVITLGEMGHKRFKRLDYVSSHYGIEKIDDFKIENIISEIQKIGKRNKKKLVIWKYKEWENIGRVYFKIENIKITNQWGSDYR